MSKLGGLRTRATSLLLTACLISTPAFAGRYLHVLSYSRIPPSDPGWVGPYAIMHPPGYTGAGGPLVLSVCISGGLDPRFIGPLQQAMRTWNQLQATTANCQGVGCRLWEEGGTPVSPVDSFSVFLHELGHCAMGLGHPELVETTDPPLISATGTCDVNSNLCCGDLTSYTASVNAVAVLDPMAPRGDSNDDHINVCPFAPVSQVGGSPHHGALQGPVCQPPSFSCPAPSCCPSCPSASCPVAPMQVQGVSWFRKVDNDPFAIDSTAIDQTTFSRSSADLPAGHQYAASGNYHVAQLLGAPNTQAIMYGAAPFGLVYAGLAADDVNMVKMANTGVDRLAGTLDDYEAILVYQANCNDADIELLPDPTLTVSFAECDSDLTLAFPQGGPVKLHYSIAPVAGQTHPKIRINTNFTWAFSDAIFAAGFEAGTTSEWDSVVP